LLIDEALNYAQQGNIREAEEFHRKCLNRLLGKAGKAKQEEPQEQLEAQEQESEEPLEPLQPLLTEKSPEFLPLQGQLVDLLVMGGEFEKAKEELQYAKKLLKLL